jgi:opacity protein-like surface antigen
LFRKEAKVKKGLIILVALMVLGSFSVASAFDFEGTMGFGAFFDYGIGFGSAFDDWELETDAVEEVSLGFSFGGQFMYGITSSIAIALLIDYQMISYDVTGENAGDYVVPDDENWIVINFNGMYFFGTESQIIPFVEAGLGYYMPSHEEADSKFGFNGGIGFFYFFQENMAVELGGRFHMILNSDSDLDIDNTTYMDFRLGFKYFFGGME